MAKCEGTTKSGSNCKLEAKEGSRFCRLHEEKTEKESAKEGTAEESASAEEEVCCNGIEMDDVLQLVAAGVMTAGLFLFIKSFGKWMPRF